MSDELREFLTSWLEWSKEGERHPDFRRYLGLCGCLDKWLQGRCRPLSGRFHLRRELTDLLGGNPYPFGKEDYIARNENSTQHRCPLRLAWVHKQLEVANG